MSCFPHRRDWTDWFSTINVFQAVAVRFSLEAAGIGMASQWKRMEIEKTVLCKPRSHADRVEHTGEQHIPSHPVISQWKHMISSNGFYRPHRMDSGVAAIADQMLEEIYSQLTWWRVAGSLNMIRVHKLHCNKGSCCGNHQSCSALIPNAWFTDDSRRGLI